MQRLVYLCTGTSRFFRINGVNYSKCSELLFQKENSLLTFNRYLASGKKDSEKFNKTDVHADLYKPSTAKQETHVSDDLKGGQPTDTINSSSAKTSTGSGKVWSAQNPDGVHVAPLGRGVTQKFGPKSSEGGQQSHETTVYSSKGQVNIADPFKTHKLQPEAATPAQLAEAAAASAFAPDAALTSPPSTEAVFAPKISSTDVYSTTSSPTAHFDSAASKQPTSSNQEPHKYETVRRAKVFGGQDTSAGARKHPKENPFDMKPVEKPKPAE